MKCIQIIVSHMEDTLEEAKEYYRDYIIFKEESPKVASLSLELAKIHLDIYIRQHSVVSSLINETKSTKVGVPQTMKEIWECKHAILEEEYSELKYKINNI